MNNGIVVDKSYLQGSDIEEFAKFKLAYTPLVSAPLLYECVKAHPIRRASLLKKISKLEMNYISDISLLLRFEQTQNRPCGKPSNHINPRDYSLHDNLANKQYKLNANLIEALSKKQIGIDGDSEQFLLLLEAPYAEYAALAGC